MSFAHPDIEYIVQKQMAQQRTDNAALRRALGSFCRLTLRHLHGRFQPPLYVQQTPFAVCMFPDRFHQEVMGNVVKQALDVKLHNPIILPAALAGNADRIQGGFVRAVPLPPFAQSGRPPSARPVCAPLLFSSVWQQLSRGAENSSPMTSGSTACTDCSSSPCQSIPEIVGQYRLLLRLL